MVHNTVAVTLTGDTFSKAALVQGADYELSGEALPSGLSLDIATSGAAATISISGAADNHQTEDDVSDLVVSFNASAFTSGVLPLGDMETESFAINYTRNFIVLYSTPVTNANLGGRSGADSLCLSEVPLGLSQNSVRALISVDASDEIRDMPSNYSILESIDIESPNSTLLVNDWSELIAGTFAVSLQSAGVATAHVEW